MGYTTSDLITSVKKRGLIPTAQKTFQTADFLRFADEEMQLHLVPMLMKVRENYFLKKYDVDLVASQSAYSLPSRAVGVKLKNVYYIASDGRSYPLNMITVDQLLDLDVAENSSSPPHSFYFLDNDIVLVPTPGSGVSGSLQMFYFERRNTLISPNDAGRITSITAASRIVEIATAPTSFTTSETYDFIKAKPGFQNLAVDQALTTVNSTTLTFTSSLPSGLAVGDYVSLAGTSPIIQIPVEAHPVLSQRVMLRCLRAIGDKKGADQAKEDLKEMEESLLDLLTVRVEDQPKKVRSSNNLGNYFFGGGMGEY